MDIEMMKRMFPQFKITDASNRTPEQLSRIQRISAEIKNSFVFIKRNEKNAEFLNAGSSGRECSKKQKLKLIFLSF